MKKNFIYFLIILNLVFLNSKLYAETLADIRNELNSLSSEISALESSPISNPVVPLVGGGFGLVVNSSSGSDIVTYKPLSVLGGVSYQSKLQTGKILGKGNIKDIAAVKSAQAAADLATEKIVSERALSSALKEIDEAANFIDKSFNEGDIDGALAAIALVEIAISDVSKAIPSEFKSEVVKKGKEFSKSEMEKIVSMTQKIDKNKELALIDLSKNVSDVTEKGFNVKKIADTVLKAGVKNSRINEVYTKFTTENLKNSLSETLKYKDLIGETPSQVKNSVRQYEALQSGNPKQLRAFELEKFGKVAGLSNSEIQKGIDAIYNGNIKVEKNISKNIWQKLENNPNFEVEKFSNRKLTQIMNENLATEKAAMLIKQSGIDFGKNSNEVDLIKLADEIEKVLSGKVDKNKINKIKQNITYSRFTFADQRSVSASLIATIGGEEYEDALLKSSSGSIAYRTAAVEAALTNNLGALYDAKDNNSMDRMSLEQLNQLGTVYRDIIEPEQRKAAIEAEKRNILTAYGESLKKEYEFAKENWYSNHVAKGDNLSPKATEAFKKMTNLQLETASMSFQYEDIPNEFIDNYKKMEVTSIEALKLTQESVIASKNLSDLKSQEKEISNNIEDLKSQIASSNQTTLSEKKQELETQLSKLNNIISAAEINAKNASEAAKEATASAVEVASSKIVGKEIKDVTKEQIQRAYIKQHDAFSEALEAQGKNYFDEATGTVKSTFDLDKFKAATDANVAASSEWNAIKSLAFTQNPVAANNAIKEIQKAIDSGSVDDIKNNLDNSAATKVATETASIASQTAETAKSNADKAAAAASEAAQNAANEAAKDAASAASKAASEAAAAAKEAAEAAAAQAATAAKEAAEAAAAEAAAAAKEAVEAAAAEAAAAAKEAAEAAAEEAAKEATAQITKQDVLEMRQALDNMDMGAWGSQERKDWIDAHQKYQDTVTKTGHILTQSDLDNAKKK
tara:strand:+ start:1231 stop:4143 length:2913 start_codon:yes stop_codon:yes gene_type:complete